MDKNMFVQNGYSVDQTVKENVESYERAIVKKKKKKKKKLVGTPLPFTNGTLVEVCEID